MKKIVGVLLFYFAILNLNAQDFQGIAYYQTKTTMSFGSWGDKMTSEQKKMMMQRMKPFLEPVYILTFDKSQSIYKEEERLDGPGGGGGRGWGKMIAGSGGPIYKNISTNVSLQSSEFMGKKFLINDSLNSMKWVMGSEQKMIGSYMCFKATTLIEKPKTVASSWEKEEGPSEIEFISVVAWYTPQIPVNHGPDKYGGLPGLILEVNAGETVMLCTKVILNPEKKIEISEPKKGEFVNRKDFEIIVDDKVAEMKDMWRGNRRKN